MKQLHEEFVDYVKSTEFKPGKVYLYAMAAHCGKTLFLYNLFLQLARTEVTRKCSLFFSPNSAVPTTQHSNVSDLGIDVDMVQIFKTNTLELLYLLDLIENQLTLPQGTIVFIDDIEQYRDREPMVEFWHAINNWAARCNITVVGTVNISNVAFRAAQCQFSSGKITEADYVYAVRTWGARAISDLKIFASRLAVGGLLDNGYEFVFVNYIDRQQRTNVPYSIKVTKEEKHDS